MIRKLARQLFLLLLCSSVLASPYRKIDYDPPSELGPGVRDSILQPTLPPVPKYPAKGRKAQLRATVWLKVTVGELGVVKNAEVVRCITPGYGFEDAALQAVKDARFRPQWDGIYSTVYVGYYPVVYAFPDVTRMEWSDEAGTHRITRQTSVVGEGVDAPIVEPLTDPKLSYPREAIEALVEAVVHTRLQIDKNGHPTRIEVKTVSVPGYHFRELATEAIERLQFPVKLNSRGNPVAYDAYYPVYFRLTPEALAQAGIPLPTDSVPDLRRPAADSVFPQRYFRDVWNQQLSGTTLLDVFVDTVGKARVVSIAQSSGQPLLDSNAVFEAQWMTFSPATMHGEKVNAWVTIPVTFLESEFGDSQQSLGSSPEEMVDSVTAVPGDEDIRPPVRLAQPTYADLLPPEHSAHFTKYQKAIYPIEDWSRGATGWVKLAAVIDSVGTILDTVVASSSGNQRFVEAAIRSISGHRFAPGTTNGKAVTSWMAWFVRFDSTSKDVERPGQKGLVAPRPVKVFEPEYPSRAANNKSTGSVWLRLYVDTTGQVLEAIVLESSGDPDLDAAALKVAPEYRFTPAMYNGEPQRFWLKYEVAFSISKKTGN